MQSKWITEYVQERINEARKQLAMEKASEPLPLPDGIDGIADRIVSRIRPAIRQRQQRQSGYTGRWEANTPGFQGQYADEIFRRSGLYADEWARLHKQ